MRIAVCVKQVPNTSARLRLNRRGDWIEEDDLPFVTNESDQYALEEGLALTERRGGYVVAFSLGPGRTQDVLRKALAVGASRAVHLRDWTFDGGDAMTTGMALAAAIAREPFDLVLTGTSSEDLGFGSTGSILAGELGWPHVSLVTKIDLEGENRTVRVSREMERNTIEIVRVVLPAVLQIQSGYNYPRYASLKGIMAAKKKEIEQLVPEDLGLLPREVGAAASRIETVGVAQVESPALRMIEGDARTAAAALVENIRAILPDVLLRR